MNIQLCSRTLFLFCFTFVCLVNIFILSSVYINRHGDIDALAVLTERELRISDFSRKENSGMNLRLVWRIYGDKSGYYSYNRPAWLNAQKMTELGFDVASFRLSENKRRFVKQPLSKKVYVVLENYGQEYKKMLAAAQKQVATAQKAVQTAPANKKLRADLSEAKKELALEATEKSRLFAIDAGLDAKALRKKYSDKSRFMIVQGLVRPTVKDGKITGFLSELLIDRVHVPLEYRPFFDGFADRKKQKRDEIFPPRFAVKLAFGSRLSPRIVSVRSLEKDEAR